MWVTVVVATLKLLQVASACNQEVTLNVYVEHFQQSLTSARSYTKVVQSSSGFNSAFNSFSTSASVSASGDVAGFGGFSASASFALSKAGSETASSSQSSETVDDKKTEYNKDFLQIFRKITTTASISKETFKNVETEIVDSVPKNSPLSPKERKQRSNDYLKSHFHDDLGNIHGQAYSTTCKPACILTKVCSRKSCAGATIPVGWFDHERCCADVFYKSAIRHKGWRTRRGGGSVGTDAFEPCKDK